MHEESQNFWEKNAANVSPELAFSLLIIAPVSCALIFGLIFCAVLAIANIGFNAVLVIPLLILFSIGYSVIVFSQILIEDLCGAIQTRPRVRKIVLIIVVTMGFILITPLVTAVFMFPAGLLYALADNFLSDPWPRIVGVICYLIFGIIGILVSFRQCRLFYTSRLSKPEELGMEGLGMRFDIDKAGGGNYGFACWKIFWEAITPEDVGVATLYEGDTAATINGQERVFCIAVQSLDGDSILKIKAALLQSAAFKAVCASPMFVDGFSFAAEPLSIAGQIDGDGNLSRADSSSRDALGAVKKERAGAS